MNSSFFNDYQDFDARNKIDTSPTNSSPGVVFIQHRPRFNSGFLQKSEFQCQRSSVLIGFFGILNVDITERYDEVKNFSKNFAFAACG